MKIRKFSINVGDILIGIGCAILMIRDQPLPVIVILLARAISELCYIRQALDVLAERPKP